MIFALPGRSNDDPLAAQLMEVEGVQRLPHLQHHVVGDVGHVVDAALPYRLKTLDQPGGRRADLHAPDHCALVTRTELRREISTEVASLVPSSTRSA